MTRGAGSAHWRPCAEQHTWRASERATPSISAQSIPFPLKLSVRAFHAKKLLSTPRRRICSQNSLTFLACATRIRQCSQTCRRSCRLRRVCMTSNRAPIHHVSNARTVAPAFRCHGHMKKDLKRSALTSRMAKRLQILLACLCPPTLQHVLQLGKLLRVIEL